MRYDVRYTPATMRRLYGQVLYECARWSALDFPARVAVFYEGRRWGVNAFHPDTPQWAYDELIRMGTIPVSPGLDQLTSGSAAGRS